MFITEKIDNTGLLYVTGTSDWGRSSQGGHNTEANMWLRTRLSGESMHSVYLSLLLIQFRAFKDSDVEGNIHPEDGNNFQPSFKSTSSFTHVLSKCNAEFFHIQRVPAQVSYTFPSKITSLPPFTS
jgi:hypothetical protein